MGLQPGEYEQQSVRHEHTWKDVKIFLLLTFGFVLVLAAACSGGADSELLLATTTTTVDSGLIDELIPLFEEQTDYSVKTISVGSGQALEIGARGDVDVIFLHSPDAEEEFVAAGNGIERRLVMHNDFVIVGPADDPADIATADGAAAALARIAEAEATFASRGDDSGTHKRELDLWATAGVNPSDEGWYSETGQGQGATLTIADQTGSYAIADRGTFISFGSELSLELLFADHPGLLNIYHVIVVNPERFEGLNSDGARAFADFLVSAEAQNVIADFGVNEYGQQLFVPDAGKTIEELEEGE